MNKMLLLIGERQILRHVKDAQETTDPQKVSQKLMI